MELLAERERRPDRRPIALAMASAAAVLVGLGYWQRPISDAPSLAADLKGGGEQALTQDVDLQWTGRGMVGGTEQSPLLRWEEGSLRVSVEPDQGIELTVVSEEAEVKVLGTIFTVERSALGTRVGVERGKVQVRCLDGKERLLRQGEEADCAPMRAAPLLRRARALVVAGQHSAALESVDAALADPLGPALLTDELTALRISLLAHVGRRQEARDAALSYLAGPRGARAAEVEAMLEQLGGPSSVVQRL
jgi:ferric-dicitrate binding protein FerR (iron transport regulator)